MNIQTNSINCFGITKQCHRSLKINFMARPLPNNKYWPKGQQQVDTFTKTTFNIAKELNNIECGKYINEGYSAIVYATNYDGYVLRICRNNKFIPRELKLVKDDNGLIIATNQSNTVQLMKYVKGEPLYGKNWNQFASAGKENYIKQFDIIRNLPDESFSEYIRKIINLRKNGYNIDSINPNNILLDGTHLNIVDIHRHSKIAPKIFINDFYPLIDRTHLREIISAMNLSEVCNFADEVKNLYDRIINVAKEEGFELDLMPREFNTCLYDLYHKNIDSLKYLIKI